MIFWSWFSADVKFLSTKHFVTFIKLKLIERIQFGIFGELRKVKWTKGSSAFLDLGIPKWIFEWCGEIESSI